MSAQPKLADEQMLHERPVKSVRVFASCVEHRDISAALGFTDFQIYAPSANQSQAENDPVVAIIVSDTVDDPIGLCRSVEPTQSIILLSSELDFEFRLAAARAGVKAILKRPLDPIELVRTLEDFDTTRQQDRLSVVFIDDDKLSADLNAEILRAADCDVEVVNDPKRAVEAVERVRPDLILLDLRMPEVDGMELAQVIRLSRALVSIPIVFLSAERNEARQSKARLLGGDDFIQKPIDPKRLIAQVKLRASRAKVLRNIIERDGLTGLLDQSRFRERLEYDLANCRRNGDTLCLASLDIDHFKAINDAHGHALGDQVLRSLAQILTGSLRKDDVVGRCGGEEFGIILHNVPESLAFKRLSDILRQFSVVAFNAGDARFNVTFSAGIASSKEFSALSEIVTAADSALYEVKRGGRNAVQIARVFTE